MLLTPGPASAIIGGAIDNGPASAVSIMVLGSGGAVCSGVVVSPRAVLTAAHCADPTREHRVHYMENDQPVLLTPTASVTHPDYVKDAIRQRRQSVDLALVRLAQPLPSRFTPASLSVGPQPRAGATVSVGGYGSVGRQPADGRFRSVAAPVVEPWGPGKILLWIGAPKGKSAGACAGDSGGPISAGDGEVVALTSWSKGAGSAPCGQTTQGVLLAPQRSWIDETLAGWGLSAGWR
ncbi:S1 family peptidase [Camelimonas sp. ID_303_24]